MSWLLSINDNYDGETDKNENGDACSRDDDKDDDDLVQVNSIISIKFYNVITAYFSFFTWLLFIFYVLFCMMVICVVFILVFVYINEYINK